MEMPCPLPDPLVEVIAERFRVLGEPMRIRILDRLRADALTVGELAEALGTSQQNVSKHIGVLSRAGLVAREKDGNSVRCRIADESVLAALRAGLRRAPAPGGRAPGAPRPRHGLSGGSRGTVGGTPAPAVRGLQSPPLRRPCDGAVRVV